VTLPSPSLPDAAEPDSAPPATPTSERELPFPLRFLAVISVGTLVIVLCVLSAVFSGGFGLLGGAADTAPSAAEPSLTYQAQVSDPAAHFDDGQWIVGLDVLAGVYETTVPADSSGCAWEHATSAGATMNSIMSTGTAAGGQKLLVLLENPDEVIRSEGCGTWRRAHT
jgi:hypothetical protein